MPRMPNPANIKLALILTFILSTFIYVAIFVTHWFFKPILDGALVGVIIAQPAMWIGMILAFYFATKDNGDDKE